MASPTDPWSDKRERQNSQIKQSLLERSEDEDDTWLHPDAVSEMFLRRVSRYKLTLLTLLTLSGLRHTWATLALERGIHPRVVQVRLGHSTISITLGRYSHVTPTFTAGCCQPAEDAYGPRRTRRRRHYR